jgi:hypothetical protein
VVFLFTTKILAKWIGLLQLNCLTKNLLEQYPVVVLFLDELNSAAPSVQAAAYQLILNRRIGKYRMPKNVVLVAAGNRESDKGVTYRMPTPLANRFIHQEMKVEFGQLSRVGCEKEHPQRRGWLLEFCQAGPVRL